MSVKKFSSTESASTFRWVLIACGVALLVWQFFTFMDVVKMHTAQAKSVSRSASWSGQPVGTTPQTSNVVEIRRIGLNPEVSAQAGMMHTVAP